MKVTKWVLVIGKDTKWMEKEHELGSWDQKSKIRQLNVVNEYWGLKKKELELKLWVTKQVWLYMINVQEIRRDSNVYLKSNDYEKRRQRS